MPRPSQAARWSDLIARLRAGRPLTTRSEAARLGVTPRTIQNDFAALKRIGVPADWDARAGTWRLTEPFGELPLLALTSREFAAFLVAHHALEALGDTATADVLTGVADRLAGSLPATVRVEPDVLARHLRFTSSPAPAPPRFHTLLHAAAEEHRVVALRYRANRTGELTDRDAEPLAVVCHRGHWYLTAWCRLREKVLDFRLSRIEALVLTERFFAPRAFDLDGYLGGSFGMHRDGRRYRVHLRFTEYQARWIREELWHPSQTLEELPGGTLDLRMEAEGLEDLARWVLSYGRAVEVLAPAELRERVAADARAMAEAYGPATKPSTPPAP